MSSEELYDGQTTPDTATAALSTLFANPQEYPIDLAIDPSLHHSTVDPTAVLSTDAGHPAVGDGSADEAAASAAAAAGQHDSNDGQSDSSPVDGHTPTDVAPVGAEDIGGLTTAPAKRKATSRMNMLPRGGACEFCKRRKLKCTAEQPKCRACARANRECVYSQKQQRSRVRVLEDRLVELERRLDEERQSKTSGNSEPSASSTTFATGWMGTQASNVSAEVAPTASSSVPQPQPAPLHFPGPEALQAPSAGVELFLGLGPDAFMLGDVPFPKNREPDLMTLADAAASDANGLASWSWEGMEPAAIAAELAKAVLENHKGIGEKITAHLLQVFARPPHVKMIHMLINPATFVDRLTGVKGQPPHPALVAALIPNVLFLSPSVTLNNRDTIAATCDSLLALSRQLAQHALSILDTRVLDLVAAALLRANALAAMGRFVDAWNENSLAVGLVWSVGIGKLGHCLEEFVPPEQRSLGRDSRLEREKRLRDIRGKGQICPVPSDVTDVAERIRLFWCIYMIDRMSALGWNWPGLMDVSEITTPLPRDSYEGFEALREETLLEDFMSGRVPTTVNEGVFCLQVKSATILYEASRLLDKDPVFAAHDKTAHLIRISKRHMAALPAFLPITREEAVRYAGINDVWVCMYTALMLLYGKEEVDAPSPEEAAEALHKGIDASLKMCECVETALAAGDTELAGYDLLSPTVWCITGRTMHHYANRIETQDPTKAQLLRAKIRMLVDASRKVTTHLRLAEVYAQMLHNVTLDAEAMLGEYQRPDNTDFLADPENFNL